MGNAALYYLMYNKDLNEGLLSANLCFFLYNV